MNSATHSDGSESPIVLNLISSTTSSQPEQGLTSAPTPRPSLVLGNLLGLTETKCQPCTQSSPVGSLSVAAVRFAEEPLHKLMELDPLAMDPKDLPAFVNRLNELRKAPQTLQAKVRSDAEKLNEKHGLDDADRLRAKAEGVVRKRTAGTSAQTAKKASDLANKYL
jgi:hypothetical protein